MSTMERIEAAVGGKLLSTAMAAQRRALGAVVRRHRDRKGRVTQYLELGNGRRGTLVWLHGFGDRIDNFLLTARGLKDDFRILVPAIPGFPDGWVDTNERHTFDAYASWVGGVLRDIAPERFHLMGNSLGGATAIAVAADMPERIETLVPVNNAGIELEGIRSVADEMREGQNLFAVDTPADYDRMTARIFAKSPSIPRAVRAHLYVEQRSRKDWYTSLIDQLADSKRFDRAHVDLTDIRVPTLVVWGDRDSLFPLSHGEHVASRIPGATLHVLPGIGHCPHLESPAKLSRAFREFVDRRK